MYQIIIKKFTPELLNRYLGHKFSYAESLNHISHAISENSRYHPKIHFQCSATYLFRGYLYQILGNYDSAKKDFKEAVFQDPGNQDAIYMIKNPYKRMAIQNLGKYYLAKIFADYQNKNHLEEIKLLTEAYKKNIADKTIIHHLAIHNFLLNNYKGVLLYLKQLFKIDQTNGELYLLTGIIYLFKHHNNLALHYLNHALILLKKKHHNYHITSSVMYYDRALLYYQMTQWDLSWNDLNKSIELHEKNIESLVLRAKIYLKKNNPRPALDDLNTALSYDSKDAKKLLKTFKNKTGILTLDTV